MSPTKKFVLDTNVLVSSVLIKNSIAFQALEKARNLGCLIFSNGTFHELENVLMRKKIDNYFSKEERLIIIGRIYSEAVIIPVNSIIQACRDAKDDQFLSLAVDAQASCIVTGDNDLLILHPFQNIPIISPVHFLNNWK